MGQRYSQVASRDMDAESASEEGPLDTANWMAAFGHVPLPNLVMPGSHDSGAQDLDCCTTGPDWKVARGFLPLGCCVVLPWSAAQGHGPGDLLEEGCRHFDLRVGLDDGAEEGDEGRYRLCHGYFSRGTLADFLREVREFLDEHRTEAVLLEVKSVRSFEDKVSMEEHEGLIAFMEGVLGGKGAFVDAGSRMRPVGELTAEGRQVFAVYCPGGWGHEAAPVDRHADTMLPGWCLRSKWPNRCEPGEVCQCLGRELEEQGSACHDTFLVLQGVMTPKAPDIVRGVLCCLLFDRSLRDLAHRLAPEVQRTLQDAPEQHLAHGAVVMLDWLHEQPELVDWVIRANSRLHAQG